MAAPRHQEFAVTGSTTVYGGLTDFTGAVSSVGTLTINSTADFHATALTLANLVLTGELRGSGAVTVSGALTFAGSMMGTGTTTVAAGGTATLNNAELRAGRTFVNNAAIGLYPLMVLDREAQQKRLGRSKRLAMLVASLRTMVRFHHQRLTLSGDGGEARIDTPLLFVGNNDYRLELPAAGQRDRLDDGRLCVFLMRSKSRIGFIAATLRALAGRSRPDDMIRLDDVERLRV